MLWLVGLMGAGKSTIGPPTAERLGVPFLDTDDLVERLAGESVESLFTRGEASFRNAEEEVVAEVARGAAAVVATGGGAVLRERNRIAMRGSGTVLWLRADPAVLAARVGDAGGRPLLDGTDAGERLTQLARVRAHAYEAAAHVVVDTDELSPDAIVERVVAAWPGS